MAVQPITRPKAAVTSTRFRCTTGLRDSPNHRMAQPTQAPAAPIPRAYAIVATVGSTLGGTVVRDSENSPRPVQLLRPTKTSAPIPDASRPGSATRLSVGPATPAVSMIRKAPSSGEPNRVL